MKTIWDGGLNNIKFYGKQQVIMKETESEQLKQQKLKLN